MVYVLLSILGQDNNVDTTGGMVGGLCGGMFGLIFAVLAIVGLWKVFTKAGKPGWAAIIPIYNIYMVLKVVGRSGWWLLLLLIPFVNIVIWIIVCIDLAKSFGKSTFLWGIILLFFLNAIGYILLGFGDAKYLGPAAAKS
jgi:hypothetical protein